MLSRVRRLLPHPLRPALAWSPGRRLLPAAILLPVILAAACGSSETTSTATPPAKLVFMAGFKAQANLPFVGVYVAQEKGFFREEGLDVEIRHGTPGTNDALQALLAGNVQVSTATASSVLKRRSENAPVVAIALIGQRGEGGLVALADSGIKTPRDFEGRTVGYRTFPSPEYLAMLKAAGVDRATINEVNLTSPDVRLLTEGQVDVLPAFLSNEPFQLKQLGKEVTTFDPADYGVPSLGLTYITTEEALGEQAESLQRFLRASLRGIDYAIEHPDEAIDIVLKYAPNEKRDAQRFLFDTEAAHAQSDLTRAHGLGWQTLEQWTALNTVLLENGGLESQVDPAKAFRTGLLEAIYRDGKLTSP